MKRYINEIGKPQITYTVRSDGYSDSIRLVDEKEFNSKKLALDEVKKIKSNKRYGFIIVYQDVRTIITEHKK